MTQHYLMLTASVIMFGIQFRLNQIYEKHAGSTSRATFVFIGGYSVFGLIILLIINGLHFEFTVFSLIMAILTALDFIACSYFSIKAFSVVNISLFSIFSMLGGMLLPFITGILFYHEELNAGKIVCILLLIAAVAVTFEKGKKNKGMLYCVGVFFFNGMSGVLSKIFQSAPFEKTNEAVYSVMCTIATGVIAAVLLLFTKGDRVRLNKRAVAAMSFYGVINRVANYLLLLALAALPASVQYPFVTGGVIIVSVAIGLLTKQKPSKREFLSMFLSAAGIAILLLV